METGLRLVGQIEMAQQVVRSGIGRVVYWMAGVALLGLLISLTGIRMWAQQDAPEAGDGFVGNGQMVRGTVTAASADRLAIKTDQGDAYQVTITGNTKLMKERQPVRMADIRLGDSVGAMGVLDAPTKTVHALFVMVVDAAQVKKMRDDLGKAFIAGKVTAIDELKLTILRPDKVSQVIEVDEGTSFRKGDRQLQATINGSGPMGMPRSDGQGPPTAGESITLSDIKVGDTVAGKGGLKSGVFVPSELAVMDPAARRRRRPDGSGAAGAPSTPEPK